MRIPAQWPRAATPLTVLILVLLPLATLTGLFVSGFYRDTAWMVPRARGQDLVSVLAIEPLLIAALLVFRRRPIAASMIWMGALGYVLYTYAMYSYTAYVGLFSASLFALIDLLTHLDLTQVRASIRPALPMKLIALSCVLVGAFFLVTWLGQIVPATLRGTVPETVLLAKTPSSAVHVQDLAVLLPVYFLTAVWLWRRQVWGFVLAPVMLIFADVMLLAILVMGAFSAQAGIAGALDMAPVFAVLLLASLTLTGLYCANLRSAGSGDAMPAPQTARRAPGTIEDARRKVGV